MVSILLTILKIIGISILVILGIIILLVLLVLFVPVRYKAGGSYMDNRADISGKVSWLAGIISITARYQNEQSLHIRAKVFFIPVFDNLRKHKQKKKTNHRRKKEEPQLQAASVTEEQKTEQEEIDTNNPPIEIVRKPLAEEIEQTAETERTADEAAISEIEGEESDKTSILQKIQNILIKFIEFSKNIKFTFQKIYVIIINIKDNIKYYLELLQQESTKRAFALCKKQFLRILKNLCPQKCSVKLHLGFEDPSVLGNVLAIWGMTYPLHMGKIDISPEFEQEIIEGTFSFKGRVNIYILLWTAWLFLMDKNIKQLRKQFNI